MYNSGDRITTLTVNGRALRLKLAGVKTEIASNRSSIAYYLARCLPQICRVYTFKEKMKKLAQAISSSNPNLKQYVK